MNIIDTTRHVEIFSPEAFGDRRIDIIGVGATGSFVADQIARLGVSNLHVWDFDKVEPHNVANTIYLQSDIERLKVDALSDIIEAKTGLKIKKHSQRVDGSQKLGDIVFLLTDTMSSRKEIWQNGIRYKMGTKLMIVSTLSTRPVQLT